MAALSCDLPGSGLFCACVRVCVKSEVRVSCFVFFFFLYVPYHGWLLLAVVVVVFLVGCFHVYIVSYQVVEVLMDGVCRCVGHINGG